jgi:phosphoribosylanthranilate isomerase
MSVIVKICGLNTAESVAAALESGADMVGFVFFPPSPRALEPAAAATLAAPARGRAEIVALTVDMDDAGLDALVAAFAPDWLQLHGSEPPDQVRRLKARHRVKVMKAIGVRSADDLAAVERYRGVADRILFDAKPPTDADRPGGHGRAFDWPLLAGQTVPYMLSGGLAPDNVAAALAATGAPGVDVSSGVERAVGVKDPARIRAFLAAVRAAERRPAEVAAS